MKIWNAVLGLVMGVVPVSSTGENPKAFEDKCARTAQSEIYSNAVYIEEAGDVVGYELALQRNQDTSVSAILFDYEGVPTAEGIRLTGRMVGDKLTLEGKWEMPSEKQIVETSLATIRGTLDARGFRGIIRTAELNMPTKVQLKRVKYLWGCKR